MGRPKGSKNKKVVGIYTIKMERQIDGSPSEKINNGGWVNYGIKNNYPDQLLELYLNSPTHKACIDFTVNAIVGGGVDLEKMEEVVCNYQYGWDELIRRVSLDYALFNSFSIQIIKNKDNKTYSFYHVPVSQVRCSKKDEDGVIESYWICQDWTATSKYKPVEIKATNMEDNLKQGEPYLYVYKAYSPTNEYYSTPKYIGAIKAIQSEIEINNFDLRQSVNSFCPAGMLSLPPAGSEEQKMAIIKELEQMFVGSDNANQLMINFRNDSGDEPVKFEPFEGKQTNVNLYDSANDRVIDRILASHSIPSRQLVGIADKGSTGFNSEGALLEAAYRIYNTLYGNGARNTIIKSLNMMFRLNGIDQEIVLKPLSFIDVTVDTTVEDINKDVVSEDNVEEQVISKTYVN